ncbi:MAG: acyl-CoA/acyl-ACP dehydrogenase [Akkermansiaceae bacterium]|nr:acyl-CoA/acyl-ACP dehydrogenase [Armatimonadota bacterium]
MENSAETNVPADTILNEDETRLLATAKQVCDTLIEPRAEAVDNGDTDARDNLIALADAGLVGVTTSREWGGKGCSGAFQREFTEALTAACGTTWFIVTQHLGSCGTIAGSKNQTLRERYLRDMAAGRHYVGVGFGHLRRKEPMILATQVLGGYRLTGTAPWVTGYPYLSGIIFGASLDTDTDRHVYLYAPAGESDALRSTPPLPLCAMNATATTEVTLHDLFVPEEDFVKWSSREEMARGDFYGIAGATAPPLGCATGALRTLRGVAQKRGDGLPMLPEAVTAFETEIANCRNNARRIADGPKDTPVYQKDALDARAWAIELAVRVSHAAIAAAGGAGNSRLHPAQRRFREAMFYTLTAQTGDILSATVRRLTR